MSFLQGSLRREHRIFPANVDGYPPGHQHRTHGKFYLQEVDLIALGVPVFLVWNGVSQYVLPNDEIASKALLSSIQRIKIFTGPVDPASVSGIALGPHDQWRETS